MRKKKTVSGLEAMFCMVLVKKYQEHMDRCTDCHDLTDILRNQPKTPKQNKTRQQNFGFVVIQVLYAEINVRKEETGFDNTHG